MKQYKITPNTGGHIFANIEDNIENVEYSKYAIEFHATSIAPVLLEMIELKLGPCKFPSVLKNVKETAYSIAEEQLKSIRKEVVPEPIKEILGNDGLRKKEQISLLKGVHITAEQLGAIFLYAEDQGYLFSNIRYEGEPKAFDPKDVPSFIHLTDDGGVEHTGETILTDGQLKNIVEQSNFIVARFLTRGSVWHCLVQDKRGIMGRESGKMGSTPHLHYFSSAFGLTLEDAITSIKNGSYPHTPIHIPLLNY